jgi:hypothetical protein
MGTEVLKFTMQVPKMLLPNLKRKWFQRNLKAVGYQEDKKN